MLTCTGSESNDDKASTQFLCKAIEEENNIFLRVIKLPTYFFKGDPEGED